MRSMWFAGSDYEYAEGRDYGDRPSPRMQFDCDCNGLLNAIRRHNPDAAFILAQYVMRKARNLGLYRDGLSNPDAVARGLTSQHEPTTRDESSSDSLRRRAAASAKGAA